MTKRELIPAASGRQTSQHTTTTTTTTTSTFPSMDMQDEETSNLTDTDTVFWFLDENYPSSDLDLNLNSSSTTLSSGDVDDFFHGNEEDGEVINPHEIRAFWEQQEQLLEATLCRTSSIESKIRQATRAALRESKLCSPPSSKSSGTCSSCPPGGCCRTCLRREVFERLRGAGFNCSIRKSKWKSSPEIPSGEHTYLELEVAASKKKPGEGQQVVRVIVELSFRAEFEMATASVEYKRLVAQLPEVFVGKPDRLRALVKILCGAAKRCMKDKGMHLGPWRKHKYMQSKWLLFTTTNHTSCTTSRHQLTDSEPAHTTQPQPTNTMLHYSKEARPVRPKASMLTSALLHNHNNLMPLPPTTTTTTTVTVVRGSGLRAVAVV